MRPGGPFRPKDSAAIVQTPFQNAYFGAFDQDWYSHNVIPLRIEDPAERLAALARRDAIYADPLVLRNRLRPALYQLAVHGVTKFFTLNPAGTYGHPHHSALSEAVADLAVEISEQHGISVEVWNDATLRRQPADPDPTGQILWHQAIDIPGAHYIGPFPVPEDNVLSALYESYLPRHIDEELGVSTHTWHKDGRDILVNDNNGPYPPGQYFFLRVGHNPVTGKIDDVMKRAGDEYEAMRAFWHEVKRNIIPPTYLGNPRVMRQALQERWAYEPLGTEPAESFGKAPILAPVL